MDSLERVRRTFEGRKVDRPAAGEDFWDETLTKWRAEGRLGRDESPADHFALDLDRAGLISWYANPALGWTVLEENETTMLVRNPDGATTRVAKRGAGGVEHVAYAVTDRESWERLARPNLCVLDPGRIPFARYAETRRACAAARRHFSNDAFGPFEMMHRLVGHETLLAAMALDPAWVKDMATTYCEFNIRHWDELFRAEGLPQSTWLAEDLGFKGKPFMSRAMFEDILLPGYARMFRWLHDRGLKAIVHSCGYVAPFVPLLRDAGMDCLEGMECKAGMDLPAIFKSMGDCLVWCGNIDIRALETNDRGRIQAEIDARIAPVIRAGGRYIIHSDHSLSPLVEYDTYRWFLDRARAAAC
jgi:uroporphyrinogen decarboxylase